jgi:hypothetical protein
MRAPAVLLVSAIAALALAGPADAAPAPVKEGRYAGGSARFHILMNVTGRTIPLARIYSEDLASCSIAGPAIFDSDTVDANGRFRLANDSTFVDNAFVVNGRFISSTHIVGKVKWTTSNNCPAGVYKFAFTADRFAPVS